MFTLQRKMHKVITAFPRVKNWRGIMMKLEEREPQSTESDWQS